MKEELKPCPKCGGEAFIEQIGNEHTKKRGWDVGCKVCRITISDRTLRGLDTLLPLTIRTWNTRHIEVTDEMVEDVVEALWRDAPTLKEYQEILELRPPEFKVKYFTPLAKAALKAALEGK